MEIQQPVTKKVCGNCLYGDYYSRKVKQTTYVDCEVYTQKFEKGHKACHNWKEKKK